MFHAAVKAELAAANRAYLVSLAKFHGSLEDI